MNKEDFRAMAQNCKTGNAEGAPRRFYLLHRRISHHISWCLMKCVPSITPNSVTLCAIVLNIIGCATLAVGEGYISLFSALALCYAGFLCDKIDGEIARVKDMITYRGKYLDELYHFTQPVIYFALVIRFAGRDMAMQKTLLAVGIIFLFLWDRFRVQLTRPSFLRFKEGNIEKRSHTGNVLWKRVYSYARWLVRYDGVLIQIIVLSLVIMIRGKNNYLFPFLIYQLIIFSVIELSASLYDLQKRVVDVR